MQNMPSISRGSLSDSVRIIRLNSSSTRNAPYFKFDEERTLRSQPKALKGLKVCAVPSGPTSPYAISPPIAGFDSRSYGTPIPVLGSNDWVGGVERPADAGYAYASVPVPAPAPVTAKDGYGTDSAGASHPGISRSADVVSTGARKGAREGMREGPARLRHQPRRPRSRRGGTAPPSYPALLVRYAISPPISGYASPRLRSYGGRSAVAAPSAPNEPQEASNGDPHEASNAGVYGAWHDRSNAGASKEAYADRSVNARKSSSDAHEESGGVDSGESNAAESREKREEKELHDEHALSGDGETAEECESAGDAGGVLNGDCAYREEEEGVGGYESNGYGEVSKGEERDEASYGQSNDMSRERGKSNGAGASGVGSDDSDAGEGDGEGDDGGSTFTSRVLLAALLVLRSLGPSAFSFTPARVLFFLSLAGPLLALLLSTPPISGVTTSPNRTSTPHPIPLPPPLLLPLRVKGLCRLVERSAGEPLDEERRDVGAARAVGRWGVAAAAARLLRLPFLLLLHRTLPVGRVFRSRGTRGPPRPKRIPREALLVLLARLTRLCVPQPAVGGGEGGPVSTRAGTARARMKEERKRMKALGGRGMCAGEGVGVWPSGEEGEAEDEGEGAALRLYDRRLGPGGGEVGSKMKNEGAWVSQAGWGRDSTSGGASHWNAVSNADAASASAAKVVGVILVAKAIPPAAGATGCVHTSCVPAYPIKFKFKFKEEKEGKGTNRLRPYGGSLACVQRASFQVLPSQVWGGAQTRYRRSQESQVGGVATKYHRSQESPVAGVGVTDKPKLQQNRRADPAPYNCFPFLDVV
ncbi:hypothetical protein DFH09DRAFT_1095940 [Mycena vulgaris]|nr:hypothetical protein DFH09DRAFT_1095940 [Mycena vulgaris]